MGRAPRAEDRPAGGRTSARKATVEVRDLSGNVGMLKARIETLENELRNALNLRNYFERRCTSLKKELKEALPPTLKGRTDAMGWEAAGRSAAGAGCAVERGGGCWMEGVPS